MFNTVMTKQFIKYSLLSKKGMTQKFIPDNTQIHVKPVVDKNSASECGAEYLKSIKPVVLRNW
jgi:hypothetical protein